jgi:hypothetical protein
MRRAPFLITAAFSLIFLLMLNISLTEGDSYAYSTELISLMIIWIPPFLSRRGVIDLPWPIIFLIAFSLFLNALGLLTLWYYSTAWWDKLTHLVSGTMVATFVTMALLVIKENSKTIRIPPKWMVFFIFISVVAFEVIWEMFEFTMDSTVGTNMQHSLQDTANDILSNFINGLLVGVVMAYYLKGHTLKDFVKGLHVERTVAWFRRNLIEMPPSESMSDK